MNDSRVTNSTQYNQNDKTINKGKMSSELKQEMTEKVSLFLLEKRNKKNSRLSHNDQPQKIINSANLAHL